ncbi:hypothetical protein BaRGS_00031677 [Batillaria attramentaria]|uniref:Uncharacterized protein n=1 Tax=Batillaria attramentaria TaxID=370345 RepID=A0ABD0JQQ9_9CAEN
MVTDLDVYAPTVDGPTDLEAVAQSIISWSASIPIFLQRRKAFCNFLQFIYVMIEKPHKFGEIHVLSDQSNEL